MFVIKTICGMVVMMLCTVCAAAIPLSDGERIADLERRLSELTIQVNRLLAEREQHSIHVCTLSAFTDTYQSENRHRGRARLDVLNECRQNHDGMFCREQNIRCETYD